MKIAGSVAIIALLAVIAALLSYRTFSEAVRPLSLRPPSAQEKGDAETKDAKADHNYANANPQQQPPGTRPSIIDTSHPQAAQQKADAPTADSSSGANQESVLNPWQPAFNLLLVIFTGT